MRVKRITSHAGIARYLADCEQVGYIPRDRSIPSPYAYSPTHTLYLDSRERLVFIVETAHRQYDVFLHVGEVFRSLTQAEQAYVTAEKTPCE
jgi:hypothetical protein